MTHPTGVADVVGHVLRVNRDPVPLTRAVLTVPLTHPQQVCKILGCDMVEIVPVGVQEVFVRDSAGAVKPFVLRRQHVLLIDEDGKGKRLGHNELATILSGLWPHDFIAGDAVLLDADYVR